MDAFIFGLPILTYFVVQAGLFYLLSGKDALLRKLSLDQVIPRFIQMFVASIVVMLFFVILTLLSQNVEVIYQLYHVLKRPALWSVDPFIYFFPATNVQGGLIAIPFMYGYLIVLSHVIAQFIFSKKVYGEQVKQTWWRIILSSVGGYIAAYAVFLLMWKLMLLIIG